jgi:hypothetical protein
VYFIHIYILSGLGPCHVCAGGIFRSMNAAKEFLSELADRKVSIAVFLTISGGLLGFGGTVGAAMLQLSNVNNKVNVMVGKVNDNAKSIAELRGQAKDKNEVLRAISNQAMQNAQHINANRFAIEAR